VVSASLISILYIYTVSCYLSISMPQMHSFVQMRCKFTTLLTLFAVHYFRIVLDLFRTFLPLLVVPRIAELESPTGNPLSSFQFNLSRIGSIAAMDWLLDHVNCFSASAYISSNAVCRKIIAYSILSISIQFIRLHKLR
jgi:hypothetical protein